MDLSLLLLIGILVFDFVVSIWNAYAAGSTLTLLRGESGQGFARVAAGAGLGLAFAGMAYVMLILFAFLAFWIGFLGAADVAIVLAFDFLVFGAMIIGFGLVVTAQSIAIAYRRRNFASIAISGWNIFAEVWDIAIYAQGFRAAYGTMSGGGRNRTNLYVIIILAVLVAFFITYAAYRHGARTAEQALRGIPYSTGDGSTTWGSTG